MLESLGYVDLPAHAKSGGFDHAAVHGGRGRLYVAHTANDALDVIDCATQTYVRSIPDLPGVAGALVSEEQDLVFTSNRGDDTIGIVSPERDEVVAKVGVGVRPNGLVYDPRRRLLLAANVGDPSRPGSFTVSMVDIAQREVIADVPVAGRTRWAIFDPATDGFYVNIADPPQIAVIEASAPAKVARTFSVPAAGPHGLDLDPAERRLFCACDGKRVIALESRTGVVTDDIEIVGANANFPGNRTRCGLPTIQGVIVIVDGEDGRFLALMDSSEVTVTRTAAATAIAAKHLARRDATTLTLCGCGVQGQAHVRALAHVLPLRTVRLFDSDPAQMHRLASELSSVAGLQIELAKDLTAAVRASDVCVTCTPSRTPLLTREALVAGLFVAAVGADSHEKHELVPEILSTSKLVVGHLEQCATIGDLHHALAAGVMSRDGIHAELPELVAGRLAPPPTVRAHPRRGTRRTGTA